MKALSMKQPVPELILQKKKTIELRNWNTTFRGEFFLHASMNELKGFQIDPKQLTKGALVGTASLVNVIKFNTIEEFKKMQDKHLARDISWFKPGKTHGFVLENPYRLESPIPMKGQLQFFDVGRIEMSSFAAQRENAQSNETNKIILSPNSKFKQTKISKD